VPASSSLSELLPLSTILYPSASRFLLSAAATFSCIFSDRWRYAAFGAVTGTAAVVAAPVVLSAVGFTAGGVAAGSIAAYIQSAFYGGYVSSGSLFALLQSAGAAGIGLTGNVAIGGTFGGIGALGAKIFVCFISFHFVVYGHVLSGYPIFIFTEHSCIQPM